MLDFENIIFDYGGVIINLDVQKTLNGFADVSKKSPAELINSVNHSTVFNKFEKGLINEESFFEGVREILDVNITNEEIVEIWNAMILEIPEARISLLRQLSGSHRIYLLSNTNSIHLKRVGLEVRKVMEDDFIDSLFEKAYYSHLMGKRKPDADIYEQVIDENNLDASKSVFLDDNLSNLEGAQKVGLNTYHITEEKGILDIFR